MKRLLAIAGILAGAVAFADEPRPEQPALRRRPYQVAVRASFAADPAFSPSSRRTALDELANRLDGAFGAVWQMRVAESGAVSPAGREGLARLASESLPSDSDRTVFVAFDRVAGRTIVTSRTWNSVSRWLSPPAAADTLDPRSVPAVAADLVAGQFRPTLSVDEVRDDAVQLTLQAGDFPTADPDRPQLAPGDILQPVFRYVDRTGEIRRIDVVPFTYLEVDSIDGPAVSATLITGLRSPLGTNRRRGVDLWAVGLRPTLDSTTLRLSLRGSTDRPLVGSRVVVTAFRPGADHREGDKEEEAAPREPPRRLIAGRQGQVRIPAGEPAVVWLSVLSGEALLAKLPFVPGVDPFAPLELPDDSIRLGAEGEIELLKGRLVDAVARRATLASRIRARARLGDWKEVDRLLAELDTHPGVDDFERQLRTIRVSATEAAQARGDRVAEARVRQLASDAQQLIRRYLDPDKLAALREELRELRQLEAN